MLLHNLFRELLANKEPKVKLFKYLLTKLSIAWFRCNLYYLNSNKLKS